MCARVTGVAASQEASTFYYPCPCGDKFQITIDELLDGEGASALGAAMCPGGAWRGLVNVLTPRGLRVCPLLQT